MNKLNTEPSETRSSDRNRLLARRAIIFALGLVLCAMLIPAIGVPRASRLARTHGETHMITAAVRAYHQEFGTVPTGTPAELMKAIRGANPKGIVFFVFEPNRFNSSGEFLDAWSTAFHIDVSEPIHPRVYSSGPNRTDEQGQEGSDDIVNWR